MLLMLSMVVIRACELCTGELRLTTRGSKGSVPIDSGWNLKGVKVDLLTAAIVSADIKVHQTRQ